MALKRILVISDLHVGSTIGLWPGTFKVEGGGTYTVNVYQEWLLKCWDEMLEEVSRMRPKPIVVLNGDEVQGVHDRDGQLVTNKTDIQASAALTLLEELREAAGWRKPLYIIRGTEWHIGKAAENIEQMAERLKAVKDPASGASTWWDLYLDVGGPVIHFAHHVGKSSVPWYESTVPLRDLLLFLAELNRFFDKAAPNVKMTVRSHRHRYIHVDVPPNLHAIVTPGWQLKTGFAFKVATSMIPQVGYVIIDWDGQDLIVKSRLFPLPARHVEELP